MIERRVEVKTVCPAELLLPIPAEPEMPADAAVDTDDATLGWIADISARAALLVARLTDARTACPNG